MYKNNYVVAVIANGNIVEEDSSRRVALPFGQEFGLKLINKSYNRSAADVRINGEDIARFVLAAGESYVIERYVDGNLNSGRRFKFVSVNNSAVKDKKDFENGLIEVSFYKEKLKPAPIIIREEHHHYDPYPWDRRPYIPPQKPWRPSDPIYRDYPATNDHYDYPGMTFNSCSKGLSCGGVHNLSASIDGATVRGSESKQEFREVTGLEWESSPTILKLKLVNGEITNTSKYCSSCGRRKRDGDKFCGKCGSNYI